MSRSERHLGRDNAPRGREQRGKVCVATPYLEGSVLSIARYLERTGQLGHLVVNVGFAQPFRDSGRFGSLAVKKVIGGISAAHIVRRATLPEVGHLLIRRVLASSSYGAPLAAAAMYSSKAQFDRSVSRWLDSAVVKGGDISALVGMFGSSAESFEIARKRGVATILNFVNSHPEVHNRLLTDLAGLSAKHHEMVPEAVCRRVEREISLSDAILVPSQFVENQLIRRGVPPSKVHRIPYGVDGSLFRPSSEEFRDSGPTVVYVGQISYRKGVAVLSSVARRLPNCSFLLVGPVVSRDILSMLPENVTVVGSVGREELVRILVRSAVMAVPSLEDAYCLAALEGMASGLPVVLTANNGVAELVEDGANGFVVPAGDVTSLADRIELLLEDESLRRDVGRAGAVAVRSHQSWESYGARCMEVVLS